MTEPQSSCYERLLQNTREHNDHRTLRRLFADCHSFNKRNKAWRNKRSQGKQPKSVGGLLEWEIFARWVKFVRKGGCWLSEGSRGGENIVCSCYGSTDSVKKGGVITGRTRSLSRRFRSKPKTAVPSLGLEDLSHAPFAVGYFQSGIMFFFRIQRPLDGCPCCLRIIN